MNSLLNYVSSFFTEKKSVKKSPSKSSSRKYTNKKQTPGKSPYSPQTGKKYVIKKTSPPPVKINKYMIDEPFSSSSSSPQKTPVFNEIQQKNLQMCYGYILPFILNPPTTVRFNLPASKDYYNLSDCVFQVPKVILRLGTSPALEDNEYTLVCRHGMWTVIGGSKATASLVRETNLSLSQLKKLICESALQHQNHTRLEVEVSILESNEQCNNLNWDPEVDTQLIKLTKYPQKSAKKNAVIEFNKRSSYPADKFEWGVSNLGAIFYSDRGQVSIWDPKEMNDQE